MTKQEKQKAVIYCRVSDSSQNTEDTHGLQSQEWRCREYADRKAYDVVDVFHDDISGKHAGRPALTAMLALLQKHKKTHIVIVDSTTRLARSMRAHLSVRDAIASVARRLESPTKVYEDDAEEDIQEIIEAAFSGHQRRENAIQTKNRMRARTLAGYWCLRAPVGYQHVKVEGHGKMLVRDEPAASIVAEALEGYAFGRFETQTEVQRWLGNRPEYPEHLRRNLTRERIREMLTRPVYAGFLSVPEWELHLVPGKHDPLISFETYQRIQNRMTGRAKAPSRKDLNVDFPLRGFINCQCGKPLMGCWSKARNGQRHPYYLCQRKGCAAYGKSIRRDILETEFGSLLAQMTPDPEMFEILQDMMRDLWDGRIDSARSNAQLLKAELAKVEREESQFLDRIIATDNTTLINAYEGRIRKLGEDKTLLRERVSNCGRPLASFDATFRTAIQHLANPQKLWVSDRLEDKRAVLKLTFADRLTYVRGEGFRTALTSSPFALLSNLREGGDRMVPEEEPNMNHKPLIDLDSSESDSAYIRIHIHVSPSLSSISALDPFLTTASSTFAIIPRANYGDVSLLAELTSLRLRRREVRR